MSEPRTVWLFGKPYWWLNDGGTLSLERDRNLEILFPRTVARGSKRSWAQVEHKFMGDLRRGKSALAAQAALYAQVVSIATPCSRCGKPAPPYESLEMDPLCSECVTMLSYSELWRKIDLGQ